MIPVVRDDEDGVQATGRGAPAAGCAEASPGPCPSTDAAWVADARQLALDVGLTGEDQLIQLDEYRAFVAARAGHGLAWFA